MTGNDAFEDLIAHARTFDTDYYADPTAAYEALLAHIRANPLRREVYGIAILATLAEGPDIFDYCMGRLKWPEVEKELRAMATQAAAQNDRRAQFYYEGALLCFQADHPL